MMFCVCVFEVMDAIKFSTRWPVSTTPHDLLPVHRGVRISVTFTHDFRFRTQNSLGDLFF